MKGRRRKSGTHHALSGHGGGADELRARVRQVLLAIGAVEFLGVLWDWIEDEKMSRHGLYLSVRVDFTRGI